MGAQRRGRLIFSREINRRRRLRFAGVSKPLFRKELNAAMRRYRKAGNIVSELRVIEADLIRLKSEIGSSGEGWKPEFECALKKIQRLVGESGRVKGKGYSQRGRNLADWEAEVARRKKGFRGAVRLALAGGTARAKLKRLGALKKAAK